ncbi:hypothetical protein EDD22DRAFT_851768 [Suillus occidentalis]|nr:hypothetical protein EDD22DRAFT_851768 [Suillus occidentalis]
MYSSDEEQLFDASFNANVDDAQAQATGTVSFPYLDLFPATMTNQNAGEQPSALFTTDSFLRTNLAGLDDRADLPVPGAGPPSAFQSAGSFNPDPSSSSVDSQANPREDRYDPVMAGTGEGSSTSIFDDSFPITIDPQYHPIYNPYALHYAGSGTPHPSPLRYVPPYPPPIVSIDGISTLAPNSEDIQPLREPTHVDEPLPLGDSIAVGESLPPPSGSQSRKAPGKRPFEIKMWPYPQTRPKMRGLVIDPKGVSDTAPSTALPRSSRIAPLLFSDRNRTHKKIFDDAREAVIRSALNGCPFLTEQERKWAALEALTSKAKVYDQLHGSVWATRNLSAFYKTFTVPPSAEIMSMCKKVARAIVPVGYTLRPSIWSNESELQHQSDVVTDLVDDPSLPFKFIFGNSSDHQFDERFPFEHHVISTVVLETIVKLGYVPYTTELNSLFCTAAAAVECALRERANAESLVNIDFGITHYKPRYTLLMDYIRDVITPNSELFARWEDYKLRVLERLREIAAYYKL